MNYEESFLSTCDAKGNAPSWALKQIFDEHGSSLADYYAHIPEGKWFDGETILNWLGY